MKKIAIVLAVSIMLLVGCQSKFTYNLTEEQIQQICTEELTSYYNQGLSDTSTITTEVKDLDWLCDTRGANSYYYKVVCYYDVTFSDFQLEDQVAVIKFSYGTHDRLLMSSEVLTHVME